MTEGQQASQDQMNFLAKQLQHISSQPLVDRYASVIKDLTNPSFILPMLEMDLKRMRETETEDGRIELVKYGKPLLNEEGMNNILARVRPLLTSNTTLNNLTDDRISRMMVQLADNLIKELMVNGKRYGIETNTDKDIILDIILLPIFLTLNRSLKEGERNFWRNKPPEQQQSSSIFNPFKRG